MSERILNKKLQKATGVVLLRSGEIIDFFPQTNIVEDKETDYPRGFGFFGMSEIDATFEPNREAELNVLFTDFTKKQKACYQKIDASQKEIAKLNIKSAKRQKRFEIAMQKIEGLLK